MTESGQPFGKYLLTRKLAVGGMAETYLGRLNATAGVSKLVVVKRIRPELASDPDFVRMFINEARIAASLSHGAIAQVFDFGELDGEYFLTMEYVDGPSLSQLLKRVAAKGLAALPLPYALLIGARICEGLHYAHTGTAADGKPLRFIHRDVSPQNVMVAFEGEVKVIDFGIAKSATNAAELTQAGKWRGKAQYAAPEQMRRGELDPRTDVYAVGVVLYEMLAGRTPFAGLQPHEVMRRVLAGQLPPLSDLVPELPPQLEETIHTALAPSPSDRFASAQALQERLTRQLSSIAPGFGAGDLRMLLGWLFEEELASANRAVALPPAFHEQTRFWRKADPNRTFTDEGATTVPNRQVRTRDGARPTALTAAAPRRAGRKVLASGLAGAALAATVLAFTVWHYARGGLQLDTEPPGARVTLDGVRLDGVTPLRLMLPAGQPHEVTVELEGFLPASMTYVIEGGVNTPAQLRLVPVPIEAPAPVAQAPRLEPPPLPGPVEPERPPFEARHPLPAPLPLLPRFHTLDVTDARSVLRIELDPARRYTAATEGAFFLSYGWVRGGKGEVTSLNVDAAPYYLEGADALAGSPPFGLLTRQPVALRRARALYVFLLDNGAFEKKGAINILLKSDRDPKARSFVLDPKVSSVRPDFAMVLRGLDERIRYRVTLAAQATPAQLAVGRRVDRVLCVQKARGDGPAAPALAPRAYRLLEAGKPQELTRAVELACLFPQGPARHASGALELSVVSLGIPPEDLNASLALLELRGRALLWGIGFGEGSTLLPSAVPTLAAVKQRLDAEPALGLVIEGHTDDVGSEEAKRALSAARAEAVRRWLVTHGVAAKRLEAKGLGDSMPIADNSLADGRALNRRVELVKR